MEKKKTVSRVENIVKALNYQKATIVSRTLMEKKSGTVTIFAFDRGQGLSEHVAPYEALIIILRGQAEVSVNQQPYRLKQWDFLILPASQPHAVRAVERMKMLLVMLRARS
ncbi:MAG TPA: cupin domain-containing protein [bacterium]|nr:cupin domain-containing protein [bacterium]HOL68158.1 cupin domain-containing protein [bacterium]HPP12159.1 cupin domain-containing protein [bacterium]